MKVKFLALILICISALAKGQNDSLSHSAQISLLTNSPYEGEVYTLFGHSALRVYDVERGIDVAFNYGIFDFSSPNFLYRFAKGLTDYKVVPIPFKSYVSSYQLNDITMYQQVLNLNYDEKQKIWEYLLNNIKPENRVYRYNYFYNNCTTKLTDIIESSINGKIVFPTDDTLTTFRQQTYKHMHNHQWVIWGINLLFGVDADKPLNLKEKMFLPAKQMQVFDNSNIQSTDDSIRKLVVSKNIVMQGRMQSSYVKWPLSPFVAGCIMLGIAILLLYITIRDKYLWFGKLFDFILYLLVGIVGCIILFMMTASTHPCVNANWNIVWLNPLALVVPLLIFLKRATKTVKLYHGFSFVVLSLFLLSLYFLPQWFGTTSMLFILTLWIRSGTHVFFERHVSRT